MAFKLSKGQAKEWSNLIEELKKEEVKVIAAEDRMKGVLAAVTSDVNSAITSYNMVLDRVRGFRDERVEDWNDAIADKSDAWREGERGQAATALSEEWENVDLDELQEVSLVEPDEIEVNHSEALEALPIEADQ